MGTRDIFFSKVVSFLFFPLPPFPPPLPRAFSIALLIILATNMSGFPLSNQIISAVSWTWQQLVLTDFGLFTLRLADQARPDA